MALNPESMETDADQPKQDQNLRFYSDGVKANGSTVQKKRRALNDDISNHGKPSAEQQQGVKERSEGVQSVSVVAEDKYRYCLSKDGGWLDHDHRICVESQIAMENGHLYGSQAFQIFEEVEKEMNALDFSEENWMDSAPCFEDVSACMRPRQAILKMDEIQVPEWVPKSPECPKFFYPLKADFQPMRDSSARLKRSTP